MFKCKIINEIFYILLLILNNRNLSDSLHILYTLFGTSTFWVLTVWVIAAILDDAIRDCSHPYTLILQLLSNLAKNLAWHLSSWGFHRHMSFPTTTY